MKKRLIWNDIKASPLLSFSTWAFMALCALLIALTCFLFTNLLGAIDVLMTTAQTPDYLQMHAGDLNEAALEKFVDGYDEVSEYQVLNFLNLDNANITLGDKSLSDSTQDNGVSVQSEKFDYLLDGDNQVIEVKEGELYVPVCYKQLYDLEAGDPAQLGDETLTIAGFLRDSQMTSMMSSSKRFLVSQADYEKLADQGSEEYLIEFLLNEGADVKAFGDAYTAAGMPNNGPAITKPLIKLMNALSDGLMILVILLVSVVMLLISILCIRFTLLSRLEADRREIGMLKAVGISRKDIRRIYFDKYLVLSILGALAGLAAAAMLKQPLERGLKELYGTGAGGLGSTIAPLMGAAVVEVLLLFSISRTLKRTERLSAVQALFDREESQKRKKQKPMVSPQYKLVGFVIMLAVFLMVVPQNLKSTLSSSDFVTYMGIGDADIRLDLRQMEDMEAKTAQVAELIALDSQAAKSTSLMTKTYQVTLPHGSVTRLNVELGDHNAFPVSYSEGTAPANSNEIALSYLLANDLGLKPGDILKTEIAGQPQELTVSGIYSDITNGGKTAKASWMDDQTPTMWSIFYIAMDDDASRAEWIENFEQTLAQTGVNAKIVDIDDFVQKTYGSTLSQIELAARLAKAAAEVVMLIVVLLFTRLLVEKDRYDISLKKAIGFTNKDAKKEYELKMLAIGFTGVVLGVILGNLLGQVLAGMLLQSMGAVGFKFIIDMMSVYLIIPVLALAAIIAAVVLGLKEIENIKAYECCLGRE